MGIMSQEQADAMLARSAISPEQHAQISAQNGVSSPLDAGAPPPIVDAGPPPMMAGPPPPPADVLDGGMSQAPPPGANMAAPMPAAPEPSGDVGKITPVPQPAAAAPSAASMTDAQMRSKLGLTGGTHDPLMPKPTSGATDMLNAEVGGLQGQKATQGALNDIHTKSGAEEHAALATQQADLAAQNAAAATKHAEEVAVRDKLIAERDAAVDEYRSAHVDPSRVAKGRGIGGTVLAAIAMGLGAFGASITHGPNYAMQILDKQVDDDIRAQEGEIAKKGKAVDIKGNNVAAYRQIMGDNDAARLLAKGDLLEQHRNELAAVIAKRGNAEDQERGKLALGQIDTRIDETKAQAKMAKEQAAGRAAAAASAAAEHRDDKLWNRAKDVKEAGQKDKALETDALKATIEGRKVGPEVKDATKEDAALRTKLQAVSSAWKEATQTNYGNRVTSTLGKVLDTDNASVHEGATAQLVGVVKGVGDNSEQDAERLKSMLPRSGDDDATLTRKHAMLMNKVLSQYPEAAERFTAAQVPTVAVPGEGR